METKLKTKIYLRGKDLNTNEEHYCEINSNQLIEYIEKFNTSEDNIYAGISGPNGNYPVLLSGLIIQKSLIDGVNPDEHVTNVKTQQNLFAILFN